MSFLLVRKAWRAEVPSGRKLVLLALCDHADDGGSCRVSISVLARQCSMCERTIQLHIAALIKIKFINCIRRPGHKTVFRVNAYNFHKTTPALSQGLSIEVSGVETGEEMGEEMGEEIT